MASRRPLLVAKCLKKMVLLDVFVKNYYVSFDKKKKIISILKEGNNHVMLSYSIRINAEIILCPFRQRNIRVNTYKCKYLNMAVHVHQTMIYLYTLTCRLPDYSRDAASADHQAT